MTLARRFRELVLAPEILVLPGIHDALSARIMAQAGFAAATAGGYSASATLLAAPDVSLLSLAEMAEQYARLVEAGGLPLLVDGDTGFGNASNAVRMVQSFERAGVAALFIEDQVFPKRCGHTPGKTVIPAAEMVEKLMAALDARRDPDMMIMARTDALALNGLDDAIERAQLYRQAGADLIFVEALQTPEQMRRVCREIEAPVLATRMNGGQTPELSAAEFAELGFAALALPAVATYAVAQTLRRVMTVLARDDSDPEIAGHMMDFDEFNELIGLGDLRARERDYQDRAGRLAPAADKK
ncbi:MAG: oxaloacetate decarboxylase [Alphaproteobacteria bacterium]|nr:oxaloacetate decarboxylase [Alphaproteobacteria bacterium]